MKKGYLIFMTGVLLGMVIQQYVKTPMSVGGVVTFVTLVLIFSFKKSSDVFSFLFLSTLLICYPFTWVNGDFMGYEPILYIWCLFVLLYNVFKKVDRPISVDLNDVLRFPPQFVEPTQFGELEMKYNC